MPVFVPDRKRNPRGERRVASLLDAAGHVFGELGYHAANTNAIAAEATETRKFWPDRVVRSWCGHSARMDLGGKPSLIEVSDG